MKYFSMFSGIGGFEHGIEQAFSNQGGLSKFQESTETDGNTPQDDVCFERSSKSLCIGYSEIDKYASAIYRYHYPDHTNYGDATTINVSELPDFDLLVAGFPCQAFSIAGKRKGFNDTRGTLFFDIARVLEYCHPGNLLLENVKGLLSHDDGKTFSTILGVLADIGYEYQWQVLNSKDFGVPQNRERVFIIGHIRGERRPEVFPIEQGSESNLIYSAGVVSAREKWIEGENNLSREFSQGQRIYSSDGISQTLAGNAGGQGGKTGLYELPNNISVNEEALSDYAQPKQDYTKCDYCGNVYRRSFKKCPRCLNNKNLPHTAQALQTDGQLRSGSSFGTDNPQSSRNIRRLTPIECERLQGFPDNWTKYGNMDGKQVEISDSQRYKCCGNAVTTNVITAIMERLITTIS